MQWEAGGVMAEQTNTNTQEQSGVHVPLDDYSNLCADLCEQVLAGEMDWEQMAERLFGPEPEITYTRWSA